MSLKITGIGIGIPGKIVTNDDLAKIMDTTDQWIKTRTGIERRHICDDETLLDLSYTASAEALKKSKVKPEELDLIICATMTPDYVTPSMACQIQQKIGAVCPAFDINAACSGFIYAMDIASKFITGGQYKKILIVCAEKMSKMLDWTKRDASVLFGDGSAACVVESGDNLEYIHLTAKGESKIMNCPSGGGNNPFGKNAEKGYFNMNGQEVYKFAISAVEDELKNIDIKSIDYFVLHQANKRIIDTISDTTGISRDKFPMNIQNYGNTSSASVLLLLYELIKEKKINKGDKLCFVAFGGGLTSGCCVYSW